MKFHSVPFVLALLLPSATAWAASAPETGAGGHGEAILIAEIALLLLVGRGLGELMQRLGQPAVMGSLIAGLVLGPSLFGWVWPEASKLVFPDDPATKSLLTGIADIGILMLLLLTGMEIDLTLVRKVGMPAVAVTVMGVAVPFACGFVLGELLPDGLLPNPGQRFVASLFLGTALSISSIKIVAMVVRDMNFMRRNLGQIIVASAIMEDTAGWVIVSLTLGIAGAGTVAAPGLAKTVLGTIMFLGLSYLIGRPVVFRLIRWVNDHFVSDYMVITAILLVMLVMALITQSIGVNTVLGAFVAGVLVGESPILSGEIEDRLRGFITAFLTPIFFGISGLSADLTILRDPKLLWLTGGLILVASVGKFAGAFLGGKLGRLSGREAVALGCALNARGSTEVIVASIGLSMGVLSRDVYTMILCMAVVTTMAMPSMLRWALGRLPVSEEEARRLRDEAIDAEGFVSQFERVLVVADDSPGGAFATRLAGFLAGHRGHPITILTLRPEEAGQPETRLADSARESARRSAGAGKEQRSDGAVDVTDRVETKDGGEAVAVESKKGFDLLFIGLAEMKDANGGFTPQVNELARGFDGPVALVLGGRAGRGSPSKMLIPVSGTEVSRRGAELAFAMVPPADTRAVGVHVAELPDQTNGPGRRPHVVSAQERAVLDDIIALADRHGFALKTVLRRDVEPGDAILQEAATRGADFIVIGANRRVGEALVLGKTVNLLLNRWNADLVVLAN